MNQAAVIAEIADILEETCRAHNLPLALTCVSSNSLKNNKRTLNIVHSACCVNDLVMQGFLKACIGHHLEEGQGVAGKALKSTHHCSVSNVCLLDVADYPFVDDARISGLPAALAIKLMIKEGFYRSNVDYVVEFFLPANLEDLEEKTLMDGISASLRKFCENSRTVTAPGYSVQPVHLLICLDHRLLKRSNCHLCSVCTGNPTRIVSLSRTAWLQIS
jgi:hypothetical protein